MLRLRSHILASAIAATAALPASIAAAQMQIALPGQVTSPIGGREQLRPEVAAATANAKAQLRSDIAAARITPTLTVAQFLNQVDRPAVLDEIVDDVQQIGGPRWLDDQTCQVKLEIAGPRVARSLAATAAVRNTFTPIPASVLTEILKDWNERSFSATGTSVSAEKLVGMRPPAASDAWNNVSNEARSRAVAQARQDAVDHVLQSIRPIKLTPEQTVGDLMSSQPVRDSVSKWLESQPVTDVRFRDNLQVELQVAAAPDELLDALLESGRRAPGAATLPTDATSIDELRRQFARSMSAAVGRAGVTPATAPPTTAQSRIELPTQPPQWVGTPLDAEGVSDPPRSRNDMRPHTIARDRALENLRARVGALQLTRQMTIDDAARFDPRIADTVNRGLLRARVFKVDYRADGSIMTRMTINTTDLWNDLRQLAGQ